MKSPTEPPLTLDNQGKFFTFILSPIFCLDIEIKLLKSLKRVASHSLSAKQHLFDNIPNPTPFHKAIFKKWQFYLLNHHFYLYDL